MCRFDWSGRNGHEQKANCMNLLSEREACLHLLRLLEDIAVTCQFGHEMLAPRGDRLDGLCNGMCSKLLILKHQTSQQAIITDYR